jgi:septum formation protein
MALIVLASASPRRAELLASAGVEFITVPSRVAEERLPAESPEDFVRRLARAKVRDVAAGRTAGVVVGADTEVVLDGEVLGKPCDDADARGMLGRLAGRTHDVITGYEVYDAAAGRREAGVVRTRVEFASVSRAEIEAYVATGEPRGKAGAYAIQGRAAGMIRRIEGSYTSVVGLPLREVLEALARMGAI